MKLTRKTMLALLISSSTGCGAATAGDDLLTDQDVADGDQIAMGQDEALFADSTNLQRTAWDDNETPILMCWDDSAFNGERYRVAREATERAVAETWDAESWIRVTWADDCDDGGIPVTVSNGTPAADNTGMGLNFDFTTWSPSCAPSSNTDANWLSCLRTVAVHEFGHVLGFDHEQNRQAAGINCATRFQASDVGAFTLNGDLAVGLLDPASIMSYCPEGMWTGMLTNRDIAGVRAVYGFDFHGTESGLEYAIEEDDKFWDLTNDGKIQRSGGFNRTFRLERVGGGGKIRFGDKVQIFSGDKKLCATMGISSVGGTTPAELVFQTNGYHQDACIWTTDHVRDNVGFDDVDVHDPVKLRLRAPGGECSRLHCEMPFNGSIDVRFLGPL